MRKLVCGFLVLSLALFGCVGSSAASPHADYPNRAITLVVNFGPGGGTDLGARVLAREMEQILGQPIVVENVAGGEGSVGLSRLLTAAPDGYTIGTGTGSNLTVLPHVMAEIPYRPFEDFTWVASFAEWNYVLWAHKKAGINTLDEFLDLARSNPERITYSGSGLLQVLLVEQIPLALGESFDWSYLPNTSAADAYMAVLRGDADFFPASFADIRGNLDDFVPLVTYSRNPDLPETQTLAELGIIQNPIRNWVGILAPNGLPEEIRLKLENAIRQALENPEVVEAIRNLYHPIFLGGEDFKEHCMGVSEVVRELIESGITY